VAALLALALGLLQTSCSDLSDVTPYSGTCRALQPILWMPAGNSIGVPTDTSIRIVFDDYPDPDTFGSETLLLTTGYFWVPGTYRVDLIDKAVTIRPWRWLSSLLGYTIHLSSGLQSLAGCPTAAVRRTFRTGQGPAGLVEPPVASLAEVQAVFETRCSDGCHLAPAEQGSGCLPEPAAGLSLCADQAWAALVDVPSRQAGGMRLVAAGDSARSYLLHKLLPGSAEAPPPSTVVGHRSPGGMPLTEAQLRAVASWIDGGAGM
jgi:hypothetical protein